MKRQSGFTLIEIAVVLTIVGLLIGSLLVPLTTQIDNAKIRSTSNTLTEIKQALINYATTNNRLPCPAEDHDTGQAVAIGDVLCGQQGYLPWSNLGTSQYDAWGKPLWYRTFKSYTETEGLIKLATTASPLSIQVENETMVVDDIVAIMFSYGKNGGYAFNPFKTLNDIILPTAMASVSTLSDNSSSSNCETGKICYVQKSYVPNGFDDNLIWLSRTTLVDKLVIAGKLPPPAAAPSIPVSTPSGTQIALPGFCDTIHFKTQGDCMSNQECKDYCLALWSRDSSFQAGGNTNNSQTLATPQAPAENTPAPDLTTSSGQDSSTLSDP